MSQQKVDLSKAIFQHIYVLCDDDQARISLVRDIIGSVDTYLCWALCEFLRQGIEDASAKKLVARRSALRYLLAQLETSLAMAAPSEVQNG